MGDNFSSIKVFAARNPKDIHRALVRELPRTMGQLGFNPAKSRATADRSLVVGPPDRWIHIGDTAGSTETSDPEVFDSLALAVSALAPVVSIKASDSAALHFEFREEGRLVDTFANMRFPFFYFSSSEEAKPYIGRPTAWRKLLRDPNQVARLRQVWTQASRGDPNQGNFHLILAETAELLAMNQDLLELGYTNDMDGVPLPFDEYLPGIGVSIEGFTEFHFTGKTAAT